MGMKQSKWKIVSYRRERQRISERECSSRQEVVKCRAQEEELSSDIDSSSVVTGGSVEYSFHKDGLANLMMGECRTFLFFFF